MFFLQPISRGAGSAATVDSSKIYNGFDPHPTKAQETKDFWEPDQHLIAESAIGPNRIRSEAPHDQNALDELDFSRINFGCGAEP